MSVIFLYCTYVYIPCQKLNKSIFLKDVKLPEREGPAIYYLQNKKQSHLKANVLNISEYLSYSFGIISQEFLVQVTSNINQYHA